MGFFKEYREVNELLRSKQAIVFYVESRYYYQYFEMLIRDLLASGKKIIYITSDSIDPFLQASPSGIKTVYVKYLLGFLFSRLKANIMVMTMPDLGNYLFKRSSTVDRYIYVFHAAVSTHLQYTRKAFFNYDAIFCTGNYQEKEIRAAEQLYGLQEKKLIHYGYPLIDSIKRKINNVGNRNKTTKIILIAPSWFPGCIFDTCIAALLQNLSSSSYTIIVRTHPEYEKRRKKDFLQLKQMIKQYSNILIDTGADVTTRLIDTDILITDRSGIALEFALGAGRPVLFIDTALKEMNTEWRKLGIEPIENSIRKELGISILPGEVDLVLSKISELENDLGFRERMNSLEQELFFHTYQEGPAFISSHLSLSEDQTSSP